MKMTLIVGAGSFLGGIARYLLSTFIQSKNTTHFPFGTFAVNLIGCFIIGCLFSLFEKSHLNQEWRLLLVTGFLGGFTTFSAFSAETHYLFRTGHVATALIYVAASVVCGIGLTYLGALLFKSLTPP